jgi:hypothetical protein
MSDQVSVEVLEGTSRASVEIVDQQGAQVVEVTAPQAVPIVELLHPGPQGPPGAAASRLLLMEDVDGTDRADGSVLYYDAAREKAVFDSIETKINLTDGGNF